jgi:hypothetical protein
MKNKKNIYFLLPIVIGIWALIGYKVFSYKQDEGNSFDPIKNEKNIQQDSVIKEYSLLLNYPDPFLKRKTYRNSFKPQRNTTAISGRKPAGNKNNNIKTKQASDSKWPEIKYLGKVQNDHDERELAFVKIDNKEQMIKQGSTVNKVMIVSFDKNKVIVKFNNENREIFK